MFTLARAFSLKANMYQWRLSRSLSLSCSVTSERSDVVMTQGTSVSWTLSSTPRISDFPPGLRDVETRTVSVRVSGHFIYLVRRVSC